MPYLSNMIKAALPMLAALPVLAADLTFLGYSDCHFEAEYLSGVDMVGRINSLAGTPYPAAIGGMVAAPRGIIMAGDLIDDGALADRYPQQWTNYLADFGVNGEGRVKFPVFEGAGNHDMHPNMFVYNQIKARNQARKSQGMIADVSPNGYHYSWDWDGIHFVNLNLFPGNVWEGEADAYGSVHHPQFALDFLKADLEKNVGNSGRPVVTIHHFRVIDDNWWTHSAADAYQKVLQDYNVIFVSTGHQGGAVNNVWRGINWETSNGALNVHRITPDNKLVILERLAGGWGPAFQKTIFFSWAASGLPAAVNNGDWAKQVTTSGATLTGKLLYDAGLPTSVEVFWDTVDRGADASKWGNTRNLGVKPVGDVFAAAITGLRPFTTYYYRTRAVNGKGMAWSAASVPFTTKGILPSGWGEAFVGYTQRDGVGAQATEGAFRLVASGRDIAEGGQLIDNFQYVYRTLQGDGEILARVDSMTVNTREPKVGVMLRETLAAGSRNAAVLISPANGIRFSSRAQGGGNSVTSAVNPKRAPYWVRLVRKGNTFSGFMSENGKDWEAVGVPVEIPMAGRITIGLAATAGNRNGSLLHAASLGNVALLGDAPVDLPLRKPGQARLVKVPGFAAVFPVPDRIGALRQVEVFGLDGVRISRSSLDPAGMESPAGYVRPRAGMSPLIFRFEGAEGVHTAKP